MPEEDKMPAVIPRVFYTILFMLGVGLYIGWGILFNVWFDLGVYSISIILIGLGLTGMLVYSYFERQELEKED
ncbi:hypothetical protein [[Eubacterium] cellulosolvens]